MRASRCAEPPSASRASWVWAPLASRAGWVEGAPSAPPRAHHGETYSGVTRATDPRGTPPPGGRPSVPGELGVAGSPVGVRPGGAVPRPPPGAYHDKGYGDRTPSPRCIPRCEPRGRRAPPCRDTGGRFWGLRVPFAAPRGGSRAPHPQRAAPGWGPSPSRASWGWGRAYPWEPTCYERPHVSA